MTARRNLATVVAGLGLTVTLLGGGIFAVFTDRATTGQNDASTRAEARAADLKLATAERDAASGVYQCGDFVDDLDSGLISTADLQPSSAVSSYACLRNDGSAAVTVDVSVLDLVDLDVACTGDEAAAGDTTCGSNQLGEASPALFSGVARESCASGGNIGFVAPTLAEHSQTPIALPGTTATLAPGETACIRLSVAYIADDRQVIQSDLATWRYAFDGTAS
jgi:hypothetical protein